MYLSMACPGVVRISITAAMEISKSLIIEFNGWWLRKMLIAFEKPHSNNLAFYDLLVLRAGEKNKSLLHFATSSKVINLVVQWSRCTIRVGICWLKTSNISGVTDMSCMNHQHFWFGGWTVLTLLKYTVIFISFKTTWIYQP